MGSVLRGPCCPVQAPLSSEASLLASRPFPDVPPTSTCSQGRALSPTAPWPWPPQTAGFRCFSWVTSPRHHAGSGHSPAGVPPSSSVSSGEAAGRGSERPAPGAQGCRNLGISQPLPGGCTRRPLKLFLQSPCLQTMDRTRRGMACPLPTCGGLC